MRRNRPIYEVGRRVGLIALAGATSCAVLGAGLQSVSNEARTTRYGDEPRIALTAVLVWFLAAVSFAVAGSKYEPREAFKAARFRLLTAHWGMLAGAISAQALYEIGMKVLFVPAQFSSPANEWKFEAIKWLPRLGICLGLMAMPPFLEIIRGERIREFRDWLTPRILVSSAGFGAATPPLVLLCSFFGPPHTNHGVYGTIYNAPFAIGHGGLLYMAATSYGFALLAWLFLLFPLLLGFDRKWRDPAWLRANIGAAVAFAIVHVYACSWFYGMTALPILDFNLRSLVSSNRYGGLLFFVPAGLLVGAGCGLLTAWIDQRHPVGGGELRAGTQLSE